MDVQPPPVERPSPAPERPSPATDPPGPFAEPRARTAEPSLESATRAWPWWTGPAALVAGIVMAAFGSLIVAIPASIFGASLDHSPPEVRLIDTVVQDGAFIASAVIFATMGGRTLRARHFGLRVVPLWPALRLALGTLLAFYAFTAAWTALLRLHEHEKLLDQLGTNESATLLIASAALVCVLAPISEELLFRGYIFSALRNWRGPWPAALLTGVIFGIVHGTSTPVGFLVPLAALGVLLCLLYWRTGSLYPSIAVHSVNNSIAFGATEHWGWQIPVLTFSALALIGALALALRRLDVIAPGSRLAGAPSLT